jgi:tetratricopeptide (TPR) repeat protein/DNA-binding CsgD family transcriptional regulator
MEIKYNEKRELFDSDLSNIGGINFTFREADVASCIIHNRGEKKIASLLNISPRTVSAHAHNIMLKLGCNSREGIIDFLEKSGKITLIRKYYLHLLVENSFIEHLLKVGKLVNRQGASYRICPEDNIASNDFLSFKQIKDHLKLANVKESENSEYVLCLLDKIGNSKVDPNSIFLLFKTSNEAQNENCVNFSSPEEYYFSIFKLLEIIVKDQGIGKILSDMKVDFQTINNSWDRVSYQKPENHVSINQIYISKILKKPIFIVIGVFALLGIFWSGYKIKNYFNKNLENISFGSDLPVLERNKFLMRPTIIEEIKNKFGRKKGIQTVALVGIGGSGKTTIARQYARESGAEIVWEINTESVETIVSSFQRLAYAICSSPEERAEISQIQELQDLDERKRRILFFLRSAIKNYSSWLLIYDQVKDFHGIMKYFPHDEAVWGEGKILITTSNTNIIHSSYISDENVIHIPELNAEEKFKLFVSIIGQNQKITDILKTEYKQCLKNIPPFPLDVSIAAHYVKETQVTCSKYLKYTDPVAQKKFLSTQKNLLRDIGNYSKTRYDIITLPVDHIVKISSDFRDLLFFVSLLDGNNIPKELLSNYKDDVVVDSFLYELKNFSITTQETEKSALTFSIHSSTQDIISSYFSYNFSDAKIYLQLPKMVIALETYMTSIIKVKDLSKIRLVVPHIEKFLSHNICTDLDKAKLNNKLGGCYFHLAAYDKARSVLQKAKITYSKNYGNNHINTAQAVAKLGAVERNSGNYKKAQEFLEQAIVIFKKHYDKNHEDLAWISVCLGSVYRHTGQYDKSIKLLQDGFRIYSKLFGATSIKATKASAYLANIYKDLGDYEQARILLKNALVSYTKRYGKNHTKTAWISANLASVYRCMGEYDKALELLNFAKGIYNKNYTENSMESAWVLGHIGATYSEMGKAQKAEKLLIQSIEIYENHTNKDNIVIAWLKFHLGKVYRSLKEYDKSQQVLEESIAINKQYYGPKHIKTAQVMVSLADSFIKQGKVVEAKILLQEALENLSEKNHPGQYEAIKLLNSLQ